MSQPDKIATPDNVQDGLLDLAEVRLQTLLSESGDSATTTLDNVMKRLFNPEEHDRLPISAFGSAL
ncbi:hypothetical protein ACPPVO_46450 [Dactylosporangium sp. McL0621]|uniref:hypothetical protein n=1 Tax=Dactylosporangium sp. McL0621 TaxID=3415678 RepID=UPI003CEDC26F